MTISILLVLPFTLTVRLETRSARLQTIPVQRVVQVSRYAAVCIQERSL